MRPLARQGRSGGGRRLWRIVLSASALGLAASPAPPARAQTRDTPAAPDGHGFVEVAVAASDDEVAALVDALRELVGRLGLGLRAVRAEAPPWASGGPPADREARARVFVDDRFPDRIAITASALKDGVASAPVERSVPRAESPGIVVEQVAHAVHATLESLLSGGIPAGEPPPPVAVPAPAAPAAEPPAAVEVPPRPTETAPTPPTRPRSGFGIDATAFASGRGVASRTGPVMGGGGAVNLAAWRSPWRPSLWVAGSYNATFGTQDPAIVSLATSVTSIRAVPSVGLLDLSFLQVDLGAGAGIDVFRTVPGDAGAAVGLGPSKTLDDAVLVGQIVARIRVTAAARILVGVDVDYDLNPHRYTALDDAGNSTAVLEPWRVRPSAMLGLCVPLAGAAACAGPR